MKGLFISCEKIIANSIADEGLVPEYIKNSQNLIIIKQPNKIYVKSLNRYVTEENRLMISKYMKLCSIEKFKLKYNVILLLTC